MKRPTSRYVAHATVFVWMAGVVAAWRNGGRRAFRRAGFDRHGGGPPSHHRFIGDNRLNARVAGRLLRTRHVGDEAIAGLDAKVQEFAVELRSALIHTNEQLAGFTLDPELSGVANLNRVGEILNRSIVLDAMAGLEEFTAAAQADPNCKIFA
jgi:hypothetical protein